MRIRILKSNPVGVNACTFILSILLLAVLLTQPELRAESVLHPKELKEAARRVLDSEQNSVVWVTAKVRLRTRSDGEAVPGVEGALETRGTLVDSSGLTVVSSTELNPELGFAGRPLALPQGMERSETVAEFGFIELVLADGVTVPAHLVYRDRDLDLAFLRPDERIATQRGATFRAVNMEPAEGMDVMDDVICVSRLDKGMEREPSVVIGSISSVVRGSRTFYQTTEAIPGTPVYGSSGVLLGVTVHRMSEGVPQALVTLSSETVKIISEIAEATGFLSAKSEEMEASLTEGLTLSLPGAAGSGAVAAPVDPIPALPAAKSEAVATLPKAVSSSPLPETSQPAPSINPPAGRPPVSEPAPARPSPAQTAPASAPSVAMGKPATRPQSSGVRSLSARPPDPSESTALPVESSRPSGQTSPGQTADAPASSTQSQSGASSAVPLTPRSKLSDKPKGFGMTPDLDKSMAKNELAPPVPADGPEGDGGSVLDLEAETTHNQDRESGIRGFFKKLGIRARKPAATDEPEAGVPAVEPVEPAAAEATPKAEKKKKSKRDAEADADADAEAEDKPEVKLFSNDES